MMNSFRLFILGILISVLPHTASFSQVMYSQLTAGFQTGNADALSVHFNERLQLTILGTDHRVSKSQATEILRDFFKKYPSVSFSDLFKGEKKDSNFTVGKLVTKTETFRVSIFFRKTDGTPLIHLLEIEKENDSAL
jgi:hypothetical protein